MSVEVRINGASAAELYEHLRATDIDFVPRLSARVDIPKYAEKLFHRAVCVEAWSDGRLTGLVAGYCDDPGGIAFISSVSVLRSFLRQGIAKGLVSRFLELSRGTGMRRVALEVDRENKAAIRLYEASGFVADPLKGRTVTMTLTLRSTL